MSLSESIPFYRGEFLSSLAERHAVGVGFLFMLVDPGLLAPVVAYGAGSAGGKVRRSGHWRDAAGELGYVAIGVALAIAVRLLGWA